jgi:hypothetical protein
MVTEGQEVASEANPVTSSSDQVTGDSHQKGSRDIQFHIVSITF